MKNYKFILLLTFTSFFHNLLAQEQNKSDGEYIEFNDRKNTVHGIYIGMGLQYGTIEKSDTYPVSLKVAYVANQQFEVGFAVTSFYTDLNNLGLDFKDRDLVGFYGGLHLEPILFSKHKLNLSFPLLVGGGSIGLVNQVGDKIILNTKDWSPVFVAEPGMNILYNISRYIQFEGGIKYRFSSRINLQPEYDLSRINGFSVGLGIKVGIFNMGRNRYKKNIGS